MDDHDQDRELSPSTLPVLSRLDRLDRLLVLMEERLCLSTTKHSPSCVIERMKSTTTTHEDQCKSLASALEEVNRKGTLMDRLTMLERRVLELSLVMEEVENTSGSSSSPAIKMGEHKLSSSPIATNEDAMNNDDEQGAGDAVGASKGCHRDKRWRNVALIRHKRWLGWLRMGC